MILNLMEVAMDSGGIKECIINCCNGYQAAKRLTVGDMGGENLLI